jgi:hypothetical protein
MKRQSHSKPTSALDKGLFSDYGNEMKLLSQQIEECFMNRLEFIKFKRGKGDVKIDSN